MQNNLASELVFLILKTGSHYAALTGLAWPETCIDQAGLKLIEIHLFLSAGIKGMYLSCLTDLKNIFFMKTYILPQNFIYVYIVIKMIIFYMFFF